MSAVLGKMIMYSLSTDINVDIREFLKEAEANGVPQELLPAHKNKTMEREYLAIKDIRRSIAKAIEECKGLSIRSNGGVAFIPTEFLNQWQSYEKTITNDKFKGISIVSVDVADTVENKKVLVKAVLEEAKEELRCEIYKLSKDRARGLNLKELLQLFLECLEDTKLQVDASNNMYNRIMKECMKVTKYERLIDVDLDYIITHLKEAREESREMYFSKLRESYVANW